MILSDFLARFPGTPAQDADGVRVHCPAHTDSHESLRITVSDKGKVLIKCRAGCPTTKVLEALGLSTFDLATMTPGDFDFSTAASTDAPAGAADVAALAVKLDGYAGAVSIDGGGTGYEAFEYAEQRFGLTWLDFKRLTLGMATDLGGGPRLVVPFRDPDGVARGFQARALAADAAVRWLGPKSPDGASWSKLAWLPGSAGWDEVIVTEGPGDGLTSCALGYDTIAVRGAALFGSAVAADQIAEWLGDRTAVIAADGDPSGRRASSTLAEALVERGKRAKILAVPDDHDLSSWRESDPSRFASTVIRAIASSEEETSRSAVLAGRDVRLYPLTDLGNARFIRDFVRALDSGVRFSPEAGFFLLDGGVWRMDRLDAARAHAQHAADAVHAIAKGLLEQAQSDEQLREAKRWFRWSTYSQSTHGINAALRELQALPGVSADVNDFDRHPDYLAARNGVVDLRTGRLLPHDPALLLTRRVEVDFDPDARAPRWEQFLKEIFPGHVDTLPDYVRRLVGYGVTGSTAEQCFAVLWGGGSNGKSVFTDTLTEIFRELTVTTPFSTFEDRGSGGIPNDLAALKGARLVMAAEGEQGRPMAEAVLKRVTGRDLIAARFMRKEFFEFRPTFLLMLATNFKPQFRGQDEGLWRRVKLIPFERYFAPAERDHHLGDNLLKEAPGILAWAVRGAVEWYSSGLRDPEVVTGATKEYRETSDSLSGFLPGTFETDPRGGRVEGRVLFESYLQWADEENLPARERWTRKAFFAALEERGAVKRRSKTGVAFDGIRRARATRTVDDIEEDEDDRVADALPALSQVKQPPAKPLSGPSLSEALS